MSKHNVPSSRRMPETVYVNYVKAKVALLLGQHWYLSDLDVGYVERCWIDGKDPDAIAEELFNKVKEKQTS